MSQGKLNKLVSSKGVLGHNQYYDKLENRNDMVDSTNEIQGASILQADAPSRLLNEGLMSKDPSGLTVLK